LKKRKGEEIAKVQAFIARTGEYVQQKTAE